MEDGQGKPNVKLLIGSLHWMRKVRNACAHNERIYSMIDFSDRINEKYIDTFVNRYKHKVYCTGGKRRIKNKEKNLMDIIIYFKYYLTQNEYEAFIFDIHALLTKLEQDINVHAFNSVRGAMGVKDLDDLLTLATLPKIENNYNKFETF